MTINHIYLRITASRFAAVRNFYIQALKPLGYRELITIDSNSYVGIGTDYPYLFLRALPADHASLPTHIAFDSPGESTSDRMLAQLTRCRQRWCGCFPSSRTVSAANQITYFI